MVKAGKISSRPLGNGFNSRICRAE
jgi:hypothetical protein